VEFYEEVLDLVYFRVEEKITIRRISNFVEVYEE
jgi:hypothetical protein